MIFILLIASILIHLTFTLLTAKLGVPNYPDFGRFWKIVEKHKVGLISYPILHFWYAYIIYYCL